LLDIFIKFENDKHNGTNSQKPAKWLIHYASTQQLWENKFLNHVHHRMLFTAGGVTLSVHRLVKVRLNCCLQEFSRRTRGSLRPTISL